MGIAYWVYVTIDNCNSKLDKNSKGRDQGRRLKNSRRWGATEKRPKNSSIKPLPGEGGNGKRIEK